MTSPATASIPIIQSSCFQDPDEMSVHTAALLASPSSLASELTLLKTLATDMEQLLQQGLLHDVCLYVGISEEEFSKKPNSSFKCIQCHRALLSARSEYFKSLFTKPFQESQQTNIFLPDKNYEDFKVLIDFLYTAKININHENAFGVLKLSDELGIQSVKEKCLQYVKENVTSENVFDVLEEACFLQFEELRQFCKTYLEQNAKEMFSSEGFLSLSKSTLLELLKSDKIHMAELEIFFSVLEWGKFQVKNSVVENRRKSNTNKQLKKILKQSQENQISLNIFQALSNNTSATTSPIQFSTASPTFISSPQTILTNASAATSSSSSVVTTPVINSASATTSVMTPSNGSTTELQHELLLQIMKKKKRKNSRFSNEDFNSLLSPSELPDVENTEDVTSIYDSEEEEQDEEQQSEHLSEDIFNEQEYIRMTNQLINGDNMDASTDDHTIRKWKQKLKKIVDYLEDKEFVMKLRNILSDVLPFIRFPILNASELYDFVEVSMVVPRELLLEAYRYHSLSNRLDLKASPRYRVREGSLFYLPGVLENVPLKLLRGWTLCYRKPYSDKTSEKVFENAKGTRILIAARHKNSSTLALAAMGRRKLVLKETFENHCNRENGVYFYHWKAHSFGFSDMESINLGSADLSPGTRKVSWHLTGRGGYRVGELRNLNESTEWEKLIFFS